MRFGTAGILGILAASIALPLAYREHGIQTRRACGLEAVPSGDVMVVSAKGRRYDVRADVLFAPDSEGSHASILDVAIPEGATPLSLVLGSDSDTLYNVTGAIGRVAGARAILGRGRAAVLGLGRDKVSFLARPDCLGLLRTSEEEDGIRTVAVDWPRKPPIEDRDCVALACMWTPLHWPRQIPLPRLVEIDPASAVASAPLVKPPLMSGFAGIAQLLSRGLLRTPIPGESEEALEAVRAKYGSPFTPEWTPRFGIDYVMTAPTPLPRKEGWATDGWRTATILVPPSITVTRDPHFCQVAMGSVTAFPKRKASDPPTGERYEPRQPPPYVIAPGGLHSKCLGDDENQTISIYASADSVPAEAVPSCRAVEASDGAIVLMAYDTRGGRHMNRDDERTLVDLILEGDRPVILIGIANAPRRWRVREAYPGQVEAFLLMEPEWDRFTTIMVEGLRPEQVVVQWGRLMSGRGIDNPSSFLPWRSSRYTSHCEADLKVLGMHPRSGKRAVIERAHSLLAKLWTGKQLDGVGYVTSSDLTSISAR